MCNRPQPFWAVCYQTDIWLSTKMSSTPRDLLQIDVIGKRRKEVENKADLQKGEHNRFMLIISVMSAKFKESPELYLDSRFFVWPN